MSYNKNNYEGTVKEINGEGATVEIISKDFTKFDTVFHVDALAKQNLNYVGAKIVYDANEKTVRPLEQGIISKLFR